MKKIREKFFYSLKNIFKLAFILRKLGFIILLLLSLSGCDDFQPPIEADDFGFPKVTVSASGENVSGSRENQLSQWTFSGYTYNGGLAVIMVYNFNPKNYYYVWSSWFGSNESYLTPNLQSSATPYCCIGGTYNEDTKTCTAPQYCTDPKASYENIVNAPCIFSKGQGLYMLLTDPSNTLVNNPNQYSNVNRNPSSVDFFTVGLWNYTGMYQNGDLANGFIGGYINNQAVSQSSLNDASGGNIPSGVVLSQVTIPSTNIDGKAYFKILDRYYDDNSGFYQVTLKSGFSSTVTPPIAYVINVVTDALKDASKQIFIRLVKNPNYRTSIHTALTIFIIVYGMLFLSGILNMTQKELLDMMFKLIIVIQLLTSETSWNVFNNYFFKFFTDGINEIINIMTFNISNTNGGGTNGLTFFDNMLNLLFSYETTMKIFALLISIPSGIVVVALIYVAFALFVLALAKALILYLLAYIATSLLVAIGPIFISFLLFKKTRELFDGWINLFVSYFFQPLLAFAALAMMGQNVINSMYKLLGFKICYVDWIKINTTPIFKAWQICSSFDLKETIPVPGFGFWNSAEPDTLYYPYTYQDERYVDFPFLDPVDDKDFLNAFKDKLSLNLPMLYQSFMLVLTTYLIYIFNDMIPDLAKGLAGATGGPNLGAVASSGVQDMLSGAQQVGSAIIKAPEAAARYVLNKTEAGKSFVKSRDNLFKSAGKMFEEPEGEKSKIAQKMQGIAGNVKHGMNFIFRSVIPPGSLMSTPEGEKFKKDYKKQWKQNNPGRSINIGDKIFQMGKSASGYDQIEQGAAEFDGMVGNYLNKARDAIGGRLEKYMESEQRKLIDKFHPLNLIDKNYVKNNVKTSFGEINERTENLAILRHLGVLDKLYFNKQKDQFGKDLNLSAENKLSMESSISDKDLKKFLKYAEEHHGKELKDIREKIKNIKEGKISTKARDNLANRNIEDPNLQKKKIKEQKLQQLRNRKSSNVDKAVLRADIGRRKLEEENKNLSRNIIQTKPTEGIEKKGPTNEKLQQLRSRTSLQSDRAGLMADIRKNKSIQEEDMARPIISSTQVLKESKLNRLIDEPPQTSKKPSLNEGLRDQIQQGKKLKKIDDANSPSGNIDARSNLLEQIKNRQAKKTDEE